LCFGDAGADVGVGPVVVVEALEVIDFAGEKSLGGDFGAGFGERGGVDVEVLLGEALVGEELELVLFLAGPVLCDDVLVGCDALAVFAFEDVRFAGREA